MCKKLMFLISFVSLLGLANGALAVDRQWTNAYPWSMLWISAQNWDPVGVPGPSDRAFINPQAVDPLAPAVEPNQGPVVDANAHVNEVHGPGDGGDVDQTMRVLAGVFKINGDWKIGNNNAATATVLITDDAVVDSGNIRMGDDNSGTVTVLITDDANVSSNEFRDMKGDGTAVLEIIGNAVVETGKWEMMEDEATCTLHIGENATVTVNGEWSLSNDNDYETTVDITVDGEAILDVDDRFDGLRGEEGDGTVATVVFGGNSVSSFKEWCDDHFGDDGGLVTVTVMDNATVSLRERLRFGDDTQPDTLNVQDNALLECEELRGGDGGDDIIIVNISGGELNVEEDMMFGDDGGGELHISGGSLIVGGELRLPKDNGTVVMTMTAGSVDADAVKAPREDGGSCTLSMTGGTITTDEFQVGASGGVSIQYMDGGLVDAGEFSFSTDFGDDAVSDHPYSMDYTGGEMFIDGDFREEVKADILAGHITGYGGCGGRGDVVYDYNVIPGHTRVRAVGNPYRAWNPIPVCGATDQYPDLNLMWNAGDGMDPTDLHHVFLSTDFDCVNEGKLLCWLNPTSGTTMPSGELQLATTYTWRVESHDYDVPRFTPGQVWQFSTLDALAQDDMEDYDDVTNPIWDSWLDGCGDEHGVGGNGTGSCIFIGSDIYHGDDSQSMLFHYDNSGQDIHNETRDCNYSVATLTYDTPQNWTLYGVEILELWFYGDPDNDATALEAMYVDVNDSALNNAMVVYGSRVPESLDDMKEAEWQRWDIPLTEFSDGGVDLTSVLKLSVGFGDPTNCHREQGGFGTMYIDDIALLPHQCIPKYTPDIYDTNGDCVVDWGDVETYCEHYLEDER